MQERMEMGGQIRDEILLDSTAASYSIPRNFYHYTPSTLRVSNFSCLRALFHLSAAGLSWGAVLSEAGPDFHFH